MFNTANLLSDYKPITLQLQILPKRFACLHVNAQVFRMFSTKLPEYIHCATFSQTSYCNDPWWIKC